MTIENSTVDSYVEPGPGVDIWRLGQDIECEEAGTPSALGAEDTAFDSRALDVARRGSEAARDSE